MKKTISLLLILLSSQAFAFGKKAPPPVAAPVGSPTPSPSPSGSPSPSPSSAAIKGIKFSPLKNHTAEETKVVAVAEELSNKLVQSKCFEDFMTKRELIQTTGLTRFQVVEKIRKSNLAVPVVMYYQNNNVVGYRQPPSITIYTNRKFHAGSTACARGSNLTHEWSHALGFDHDFNATISRPRSVPYSINAAFEVCCSCKGITNCTVKQ